MPSCNRPAQVHHWLLSDLKRYHRVAMSDDNVAPFNCDERSPLFIKYVEKCNSADPSCSTAEHAVGRLP
eukprot:1062508-Amphidinium_carterae.1